MLRKGLFLLVLAFVCILVDAQESRISWGVDVTTEAQWNTSNGKARWQNVLNAGLGVKLWKGAFIDVSALSTYALGDGVCDDLQGFSNIDADNRWFRLTHLGLGQSFFDDRLTVFVGLKAADEDYFNTDLSGLFTGSSYGGNPVCTENHGISVYPEAALALHVSYEHNGWTLRESLYNGAPSDRLEEQFRFRPASDGLFNIGSVMYSDKSEEDFVPSTYTLGYALSTKAVTGQTQFGLWGGVEQSLLRMGRARLNMLAQGGVQLTSNASCRCYWAGALVAENVTRLGAQVGLAMNGCYFADAEEIDVELTVNCPIGLGFSVQPALHSIFTNGRYNLAGMLRLCYSIGN